MKKLSITPGQPFERLIRCALALPKDGIDDQQIAEAMRHAYELAHGRCVETSIGLVPIAPPLAPGLVSTCFHAATRRELLSQVRQSIASASAAVPPLVIESASRKYPDRRLGMLILRKCMGASASRYSHSIHIEELVTQR